MSEEQNQVVIRKLLNVDDSFTLEDDEYLYTDNSGVTRVFTNNPDLLTQLKEEEIYGDISAMRAYISKKKFTVESVTMQPYTYMVSPMDQILNFSIRYSFDINFTDEDQVKTFFDLFDDKENEYTPKSIAKLFIDLLPKYIPSILPKVEGFKNFDPRNLQPVLEEMSALFEKELKGPLSFSGICNGVIKEFLFDSMSKIAIQSYINFLERKEALQEKVEEKKQELANTCPHCGAPIKEGAKFCTSCGNRVVLQKLCPNCHSLCDGNANFCTSCGTKLN